MPVSVVSNQSWLDPVLLGHRLPSCLCHATVALAFVHTAYSSEDSRRLSTGTARYNLGHRPCGFWNFASPWCPQRLPCPICHGCDVVGCSLGSSYRLDFHPEYIWDPVRLLVLTQTVKLPGGNRHYSPCFFAVRTEDDWTVRIKTNKQVRSKSSKMPRGWLSQSLLSGVEKE